MSQKLISIITQLIKFGIIGVLNTGISLAVYYIFVFINPQLYLIGNIVGFLVSTFNAYFWNNKFVFKNQNKQENKRLAKILKTYVSYGISLGISTLLLYLFVDVLSISDKIAPLLGLVITIPLNFLMNKFWVYRQKGNVNE